MFGTRYGRMTRSLNCASPPRLPVYARPPTNYTVLMSDSISLMPDSAAFDDDQLDQSIRHRRVYRERGCKLAVRAMFDPFDSNP